ncbi:hypothetical protein PoB_006784300 [Plakobranchus ocellatus]|uniref:Uncharacterized protein n=1 Tax=Plakobranchus ocellatus TaxID=259542 RepID=A0AAV4DAQ3_9GAST|nr:hypothetical protein PoB_006784300 [Plakobranchus ocellatus]
MASIYERRSQYKICALQNGYAGQNETGIKKIKATRTLEIWSQLRSRQRANATCQNSHQVAGRILVVSVGASTFLL